MYSEHGSSDCRYGVASCLSSGLNSSSIRADSSIYGIEMALWYGEQGGERERSWDESKQELTWSEYATLLHSDLQTALIRCGVCTGKKQ